MHTGSTDQEDREMNIDSCGWEYLVDPNGEVSETLVFDPEYWVDKPCRTACPQEFPASKCSPGYIAQGWDAWEDEL